MLNTSSRRPHLEQPGVGAADRCRLARGARCGGQSLELVHEVPAGEPGKQLLVAIEHQLAGVGACLWNPQSPLQCHEPLNTVAAATWVVGAQEGAKLQPQRTCRKETV